MARAHTKLLMTAALIALAGCAKKRSRGSAASTAPPRRKPARSGSTGGPRQFDERSRFARGLPRAGWNRHDPFRDGFLQP